ncbi:hypothetical protein AB0F77_28325 [Streptomyces sp. NPDC026672]|uniref:hypothetical protein n=1 Tax=unclassified Streptomyces TaxID=2593676 RepID=UPI0033DF0DA5
MSSWVIAAVIVVLGSTCLRFRTGRRLRSIAVAGVVVGVLSYVSGAVDVVFADPARMCDPPSWPRPDWDRFDYGFLPPHATCRWDDGRTYELVAPWVDPLLLISISLTVVCAIAAVAGHHRKGDAS